MPFSSYLRLCLIVIKRGGGKVDRRDMSRPNPYKSAECCAYRPACFMASELKCFGYKVDCVLYKKTNGVALPESEFHRAMNELIDKTREKYLTGIR